jgi:hypothetical protein
MATKIEEWVMSAEQGDRFIYHVGAYAGGNECRAAMDLYESGLIIPLRKRKEGHIFNYIAHRTGKEK